MIFHASLFALIAIVSVASQHTHSHGHGQPAHAPHSHSHGHGQPAHAPHSHSHADSSNAPAKSTTEANNNSNKVGSLLTVWLQALGATVLISLAPIVLLAFVPLNAASEDSPLLRLLLAFAAGGLLGDVFLHLLPHMFGAHEHAAAAAADDTESHGHSLESLATGLWLLSGIVIFLIIEKAVRAAHSSSGRSAAAARSTHAHAHALLRHDDVNEADDEHDDDDDDDDDDVDNDVAAQVRLLKSTRSASPARGASNLRRRKPTTTAVAATTTTTTKRNKQHRLTTTTATATATSSGAQDDVVGGLKVHGWLNLVADVAHNFTDGLVWK